MDVEWLKRKARDFGLALTPVEGGPAEATNLEQRIEGFWSEVQGFAIRSEQKHLRKRLEGGQETKARAGYWVSGSAPFGYEIHGPEGSKSLVPNANAPLVRQIFERYASGVSANVIGAWLRVVDPAAPQGFQGKRYSWNAQTVGRILDEPTYIGLVEFRGVLQKGRHEPIIPKELWERVQERRAAMRKRHPGRPREEASRRAKRNQQRSKSSG